MVVVQTFEPSTWEAEAGESLEFKATLIYRVSSRAAMATQRRKKKRERERHLS